MKSLYFQTVGIECKLYENQQLEYRLYSWGQSVFEKLFPQICDAHPADSFCPNSVARKACSDSASLLFTLYFVCRYDLFQSRSYNVL